MAKASRFQSVRAYVLLLGGLFVIGYEVIFEHTERPTVIVAALLMMGISVPLNLDERLRWLATLRTPPAVLPAPAPPASAVLDPDDEAKQTEVKP